MNVIEWYNCIFSREDLWNLIGLVSIAEDKYAEEKNQKMAEYYCGLAEWIKRQIDMNEEVI